MIREHLLCNGPGFNGTTVQKQRSCVFHVEICAFCAGLGRLLVYGRCRRAVEGVVLAAGDAHVGRAVSGIRGDCIAQVVERPGAIAVSVGNPAAAERGFASPLMTRPCEH